MSAQQLADRTAELGMPPPRLDQAAEHRKLGDRLKSELASRVSAAEKYREVAAQSLRYIRAEMRRRGMLLPPLPPLMKDIDGES